jgi:hypothetical protein
VCVMPRMDRKSEREGFVEKIFAKPASGRALLRPSTTLPNHLPMQQLP